jgi:type II secretory ATPase GspE/PulE/Tfp pilus assembly ATPase PilB-like protein
MISTLVAVPPDPGCGRERDLTLLYDRSLTDRFVTREDLRDVIALCTNGMVLVSEGYEDEVRVQNLLALIRIGWKGYRHTQTVPYQILRDLGTEARPAHPPEDVGTMVNQARQMLAEAARQGVSDIHLVLDGTGRMGTVLMRLYGDLREARQMKLHEAEELAGVIYGVMAEEGEGHYNPAAPQKARIGTRGGHLPPDLHGVRIQSTPILGGSLMVLRLLPRDIGVEADSLTDALCGLGYTPEQGTQMSRLLDHDSGITVISGPTGSGKSTTLVAALKSLRTREHARHLLTLEDPPEYQIDGVRQIPVQHDDWGRHIEDVMRLDPDIVMVGEVRSREAALGTLQVANTGHLVLTTVHANSAWKILARLHDLCDKPENQTLLYDPSVLRGLVAQRLVQTLCPGCCLPLEPDDPSIPAQDAEILRSLLRERWAWTRRRGPGCPKCQTGGSPLPGISGRSVVAEVVATTRDRLQHARAEGIERAEQAWRRHPDSLTMARHWLLRFASGEVEYASRGGLDLVLEEEAEWSFGRMGGVV